jgi:hypothetical protein
VVNKKDLCLQMTGTQLLEEETILNCGLVIDREPGRQQIVDFGMAASESRSAQLSSGGRR